VGVAGVVDVTLAELHAYGADQSAVGAMNRPLRRRSRRLWYILVNLLNLISGGGRDESAPIDIN